ncbi:MAG: tetratricopeptide repeat protein, partial [Blastococcus sp.]|nr:tetratricopeptide repeat protein [Blastococcus sp.]
RVYRAGEVEDDPAVRSEGLARVVEVAARHGDARGDHAQALAVLERGLARHPDAAPIERVRAELYLAELLARLGQHGRAAATLAAASLIGLTEHDARMVAPDLAHAREVVTPPG